MCEPPDESAVVAGGGAHVAARHTVGDHGRGIDVADESARHTGTADEAVRTAADDPIDSAAPGARPDQTSDVGIGRRDLYRRDAVADESSARDASNKTADVLLARDRSRDGYAFDRRVARAAEESAIVAARQAVRAEEVADCVVVTAERAGERRGFRADRRPVGTVQVDIRAKRVRAAKVIRNRRKPFARGDESWLLTSDEIVVAVGVGDCAVHRIVESGAATLDAGQVVADEVEFAGLGVILPYLQLVEPALAVPVGRAT